VNPPRCVNRQAGGVAGASGGALPAWQVNVGESKIDPLLRNLVNQLQEIDTYTVAWDTLLEGQDAQVYLEPLSSLFAGLITPSCRPKPARRRSAACILSFIYYQYILRFFC
jgi:hypothetical protein